MGAYPRTPTRLNQTMKVDGNVIDFKIAKSEEDLLSLLAKFDYKPIMALDQLGHDIIEFVD